jgi:hypothetical protein
MRDNTGNRKMHDTTEYMSGVVPTDTCDGSKQSKHTKLCLHYTSPTLYSPLK